MAVGSLIFGVLAAYYQRGFKRFLGFSAIAHVGFLLIGFSSGSIIGVEAILLYVIV